jgi:hypothetical protein
MAVRNWHYGKIVILWAWGGFAAALSLSQFMAQPVDHSPFAHLFEVGLFLLIIGALSILTWHWLGGKESQH